MEGFVAVSTCLVGIAALFGVFLLFNSVKQLYEYERGVVFQLGKYKNTRNPGLTLICR
jgi:regulator of protease activity HflC (stomatin/prohibitin superfamily)